MDILRPVELTPEEATLVYQMACAVQVQGRANLLLTAGLINKLETASTAPLQQGFDRAEANL